ncbi:MAG: integration host factor subunit alpha [Nitrospira sp.]
MRRAEIASRIYQQTGIPLKEATKLLDQILRILKNILQAGESIKIDRFGKFTVRNKRARRGRNPKTGEAITIVARRVVTFQPSVLFKREINSPSSEAQEGAV